MCLRQGVNLFTLPLTIICYCFSALTPRLVGLVSLSTNLELIYLWVSPICDKGLFFSASRDTRRPQYRIILIRYKPRRSFNPY